MLKSSIFESLLLKGAISENAKITEISRNL